MKAKLSYGRGLMTQSWKLEHLDNNAKVQKPLSCLGLLAGFMAVYKLKVD